MRVKEFVAFIKEREAIRVKKEAGKPRPWTKDPILAMYRFCNVRREDDKVTRWLAANWRQPNEFAPDLWFAFCVARMAVNYIPTMEQLGFPVPWKPKHFINILHSRRDTGAGVYGPAYMIGTQGNAGDKAEFLAHKLLAPLWNDRAKIRPRDTDTLDSFCNRLLPYYAVGTFTSAQVVADIKYAPPLALASDWYTWASPGPGSKRGLNRVCGKPVDTPWPGNTWHEWLADLHVEIDAALPQLGLHAQDVQNCLCEFDKYERARLGEGTPKQLYRGS